MEIEKRIMEILQNEVGLESKVCEIINFALSVSSDSHLYQQCLDYVEEFVKVEVDGR